MTRKSISVAMAVYNGEKYLKAQIDSILPQLNESDEIIISYDQSNDHTLEVLNEYKNDKRIKIFNGPCLGVVKNFENAVKNCNNEIIFLCDQDDIWLPNKVDYVLDAFEQTNADVVLHNAKVVDSNLNVISESFFYKRNCQTGVLKNILKNSYIGCCMSFKSSLKEYILPFPKNIPMHDQWIGIIGEKHGQVTFLPKALILHRRHNNNCSIEKHSNLTTMLKWRLSLITNLIIHRSKKWIKK